MELSDGGALLSSPPVWAIPSLCLGGLAAILGFDAARTGATAGWLALARRYLRTAVPVYAFVIIFTVLVLGAVLTVAGRRAYVVDRGTWAYLLNLVAVPRYALPGVFEYNNVPDIVNQAVWVAPVFLVLLALACGISARRSLWWAPAALFALVAITGLVEEALDASLGDPGSLTALVSHGDGLSLVLGTLMGMALQASRERVPASGWLVIGAAALLAVTASLGSVAWLSLPAFRIFAIMPAGYLAVTLSTWRLPQFRLVARLEALLPGIFLLAFPLQQAAIARGPDRQSFLVNLTLAAPAAVMLSALWWRLAGRRLSDTPALAPADVADAPPVDWRHAMRRLVRVRQADLLGGTALSLTLAMLFILVMALLYIAFAPDGTGA